MKMLIPTLVFLVLASGFALANKTCYRNGQVVPCNTTAKGTKSNGSERGVQPTPPPVDACKRATTREYTQ